MERGAYGDDNHLIDFLFESGLVPKSRLGAAREEARATGEPLTEVLVRGGYVSEDGLRQALARSLGIPYIELLPHGIDDDALQAIPEAFSRHHGVIGFRFVDASLHVACTHLDDLVAVRSLRLPYQLVPHLTGKLSLKKALLHYQKLLSSSHAASIAEESRAIVPPMSPSQEDLRYSGERLAVGQLFDTLVQHALSQQATAIHFEPSATSLLVRYRIAGALYDTLQLPTHVARSLFARIKLLAKLQMVEGVAQDGRFKVSIEYAKTEEWVVLRALVLPVVGGIQEKIVLHLARERAGKSGFTLEALGLQGESLDMTHRLLQKNEGVLLVCGREENGKTTLLYTLLDQLQDSRKDIVAVENSVEAFLPRVSRTQTEHVSGVSLKARLRAALSTNPDVLLVAELDDSTAPLIFSAADRGMLLLTSVESASPEGALLHLLAMGLSPKRIAATVVGIISTRLVPRLCAQHHMGKLTHDELVELERRGARLPRVLDALKRGCMVDQGAQWKDLLFGLAAPCEECQDGYCAYLGLQEVVPTTAVFRDGVVRGDDVDDLLQEVRNADSTVEGAYALTLLEDGISKAAQGLTSIAAVLEATL